MPAPKRHPTDPSQKWCGRCKAFHPRENFSKANNRPDGLQSICRAARSKIKKINTKGKTMNKVVTSEDDERRSRMINADVMWRRLPFGIAELVPI